uniref:Uncharacterized protein n=1 Tax=uncultured Chlorobiota bacterium TaxID=156405 RepID=H5SGQ4_9BACT|nr:hypothetical protein HGMM_F27B02C42 [uncultured Chlorobiota bacterium]
MDACPGEVPPQRSVDFPLRQRLKADLNGFVAIPFWRAELHNGTRTCLDNGAGNRSPVGQEDLGHAEFLP